MKSDQCQKNCCLSGSCPMSSFVKTVNPISTRDDSMFLKDEGQARASSLPEIASLVELTQIGSMTKEEAILAADPNAIGLLLREARAATCDHQDYAAPERLLKWSDQVRSLELFVEDEAYPSELDHNRLDAAAGLMLLRQDDWLSNGHLKEIFEAWALQYREDYLGGHHPPSTALRERLLYRWKGHIETLLHYLEGKTLSVALVPGIGIVRGQPREMECLSDLRDIQLEALFRAALACTRQGMHYRLNILVPYPADMEEWTRLHDLIERVAAETLCHQRRAISYTIGALIQSNTSAHFASNLAQCADLLVLDCRGNAQLESRYSAYTIKHLNALITTIRKVSSRISLRISGIQDVSGLRALYQIGGMKELSSSADALPAFRLAAAQYGLLDKTKEELRFVERKG